MGTIQKIKPTETEKKNLFGRPLQTRGLNISWPSCDLFVDDSPWPFCPRNNLKRMLDFLGDKNLSLNAGFEPEHFLVERDGDGIKPWDPNGIDTLAKPCYDFKDRCPKLWPKSLY